MRAAVLGSQSESCLFERSDIFKNYEEMKRHNEEYHKKRGTPDETFVKQYVEKGHLKSDTKKSPWIKEESVTSIKNKEYYIEETGGKRVQDHRPGMEAFHSENDNNEPTGINIKGKSMYFQDA